MTILLQRMREELVRRTYSETTIRSYLHAVKRSATTYRSGSIIWDLTIFAAIVCAKNLWDLSEGARRSLKRMPRRPRLISAFWRQASLFA